MTDPELEIAARVRTVVQVGELDLGVVGSIPNQLPARTPGFTGRRAELAAVAAAAVRGERAVLLTGRPGTGKSALALEAAHAVRGRYPGGRVLVSLHGHDGIRPPTGHELAGRVLRALGMPDRDVPSNRAARVTAYRTATAERALLVVADDVSSRAQVHALLPERGSLLLITARTRIDVPGTVIALDGLDDADARGILRSGMAGRSGAGSVTSLARACAGLPLALRIAAARLALEPELTPAGLVRELRTEHAALDVLRTGDRAVAGSFRASYDRLDNPTRRVFRRLGALPLTRITAGSAAALADCAEPAAADALSVLARTHLVDGPGPHRMHDLVRSFACDRLHVEESSGEIEAAVERGLARQVATLVRSENDADRRDLLHIEGDDVLVAAERLGAAGDDRLHVLADAVTGTGEPLMPWDMWSRIQRSALRDARRREHPLRAADLQIRLAITLRERGRPHQALRRLAGVGRACLDAGDVVRAAGALGNVAEIHLGLGDDDRAEALFRESITMLLAATAADPYDTDTAVSLAWAQHGLGDVLTRRGDARGALVRHRLARDGFCAHDNLFGQAWAWHGTGDAERRRGRSAAAAAAYRRALALHERVGSRAATGWTEQNLAEVLAERGDHPGAAVGFARALAAAELRADTAALDRALAGLGRLPHRL